MTGAPGDLQAAFEEALAGEPGGMRIGLDRLRALFAAIFRPLPERDDAHRELAACLQAAVASGRIRMPQARHLWEREREPPLPKWVQRAGADAPAPTAPVPVWHPTIAAALEASRPAAGLLEDLRALDAWLKAAGGTAPLLPIQERSYEIFGDEKRLGDLLDQKFFRAGGIGPEHLRSYRVTEPFAMTPFNVTSDLAIAVENLATYDSLTRAAGSLPEGGRPAAVIFGRGKQFMRTCESLPVRLPHVRRLLYFGDLDEEGLAIAMAVRETLAATVLVEAWEPAYAAAFAAERPGAVSDPVPPARAAKLCALFTDAALRDRAIATLTRGGRVPQEAVTRVALGALLAGSSIPTETTTTSS